MISFLQLSSIHRLPYFDYPHDPHVCRPGLAAPVSCRDFSHIALGHLYVGMGSLDGSFTRLNVGVRGLDVGISRIRLGRCQVVVPVASGNPATVVGYPMFVPVAVSSILVGMAGISVAMAPICNSMRIYEKTRKITRSSPRIFFGK